MNKRGFTLIELLAVIVILGLLALLTSTAVTKLVKDAKSDLSSAQMTLIKSSAETWMADNLTILPKVGECGYLTLKDLKLYGILGDNVLDLETNKELSDELKIKITTTQSEYGNPVRKIEINPDSVEGCVNFYEPICTFVPSSSIIGLNVGAQYSCKVDPNREPYNFYVWGVNGNDVDLIMSTNINSNGTPDYSNSKIQNNGSNVYNATTWLSVEDYLAAGGPNLKGDAGQCDYGGFCYDSSYGPLSAMQFLQNATKTWTNLELKTVNTFGDGAMTMKKNFDSYARMPELSELQSIGCSSSSYSCHPLAYQYPNFWVNSVDPSYQYAAMYVQSNGSLSSTFADIVNKVRPVITVPKSKIEQ